jgi:CRISPR-associated protein Cas2
MKNAPPSLRGKCTRVLLEVRSGLFVGRISARIREGIRDSLAKVRRKGFSCCMVWSMANEQGYDVWMTGEDRYELVDFDGLQLVRFLKES